MGPFGEFDNRGWNIADIAKQKFGIGGAGPMGPIFSQIRDLYVSGEQHYLDNRKPAKERSPLNMLTMMLLGYCYEHNAFQCR